MDLGIVFGLAAAVCWGIADIFARGASRIAGTFRTLLVVEIIAAPIMLALGLIFGLLRLAGAPPWAILATLGLGLIIVGGAGLLYRAFAIGNIALASPIAASYSAVTALLAITISGEHPTTPQLVGIVVTLAGVVLASIAPGHPTLDRSRTARLGPIRLDPGLLEALAAMLIFGAAYWALRFVVPVLGGFTVAFIQKVGDLGALLLLSLILWRVRRRRTLAKPALLVEGPHRGMRRLLLFLAFALLLALFDTAANVAYNLGIAASLTSIVAVLSSLFSPITVLLAWIFLRERLYRWQWLGVLAIFAGVALVSL
jgi:drug/metabolite transporter (DMT)-like permease